MPVFAENPSSSSTIAEQIKLRKPRNQFNHHHNLQDHQNQPISLETDPNPSLNRSSKSTISSLFLSPFTADASTSSSKKKGATFRGLGCTAGAAQQVSVPAVIRSSAEWEGKRVKKKKNPQSKRNKESAKIVCNEIGVVENGGGGGDGGFNGRNCMVIQDVWCGPGIGLSSDAVVGSVDCVVATTTASAASTSTRRNVPVRGKIDLEKNNHRERERERERERPFVARRAAVNPETLSFLDTDTDPSFVTSHPEPEVFGTRYYRHVRHPSPDGFAEIMMLQNSFMMGGRMDRFSSWRLDIDHMSYEQLLELSDKIGYVNTGLKDDEISRCVRKIKVPIPNDLSSKPTIMDKKCSVCQEECEADDELGKLDCGHSFHIQCIKQWLAHKNICPVCKMEPMARG